MLYKKLTVEGYPDLTIEARINDAGQRDPSMGDEVGVLAEVRIYGSMPDFGDRVALAISPEGNGEWVLWSLYLEADLRDYTFYGLDYKILLRKARDFLDSVLNQIEAPLIRRASVLRNAGTPPAASDSEVR